VGNLIKVVKTFDRKNCTLKVCPPLQRKLFLASLFFSSSLGGIIAKMENQNLNKNADINEILINFWSKLQCNNETDERDREPSAI